MGMFAQTDIEIQCTTKPFANEVFRILNEREPDELFELSNLEGSENVLYAKMSSGRVQNLSYQCEQLWEFVKGLEGVVELTAPFMMEADGEYFSNEKK